MVVLYKHSEVFEDNKCKGEIFTQEPVSDPVDSCCIVGMLQKDEVVIENNGICYTDTLYGLIVTDSFVNCLDDILALWDTRKKNMAAWIARGNFHTGMTGCEYAKPGSDDYVFIEKKHLNKRNIKKISKKETVLGLCKIEEEYINDELVSMSFLLSDETIMKLERSQIGFKNKNNGLIIREYEIDVFKEIIDLWMKRRDTYEN
jgi:hypothetical protein